VRLVPASGTGSAVNLGTFTYDRGLGQGLRYSRTEQVKLPTRVQGLYRLEVVTNATSQLYEDGAARNNNALLSSGSVELSLNPRPDLRVVSATAPDHVTAGTSGAIQFTVTNSGPQAATGRWTDHVYLSVDAFISGDDTLVASLDNGAALAPGESYTTSSSSLQIPIRLRGDAYLIVVADDSGNNVDEYPNENN